MKKLLMMIGAAASCVALSMSALADLPSGYRQLDYVDTDGNQWVNTLFEPTCTNAVEIKASVANPNREQFLYCSRRATSSYSEQYRRWHSLCITGGKARFDYAYWHNETSTLTGGQAYAFAAMPEEKSGQEAVAESSKQWHLNMYIDDALVATSADRDFWVPVYDERHQHFCLFGSYAGNLADDTDVASKAICRFYHFKVWDTKDKENLLCHIVPVYGETEHAVGLYDLVAGRFLPAHGGTLAAPKVVLSDLELSENEDWTSVPVMIADGATVDLNGHDLAVASVGTNAVSALNPCYQDIGYITATGGEVIRIDGFKLPGTAKVETKFRPALVTGSQFLFSSRTKANSNAYGALISDSKIRFDFNNQQTYSNTILTNEVDYTAVFDGTTPKPTWSVDGVAEKTHDATSNGFTGGSDLCIFERTTASDSNLFTGRLYYFIVTTNGVTAYDLRPARRISDGAVGLYDRVGNGFYPSGTATAVQAPVDVPKFTNSCETASVLNVGRELVPGYTIVNYITATGSQYIDTGFVPAATDRMELRASLSSLTTSGLFCSRVGYKDRTFTALYTSSFRFDFNTMQETSSYTATVGVPFTVAFDGNARKGYVNDDVHNHAADNNFTPSAHVYLFAMHSNNGDPEFRAQGSIYGFKVTGADGTLKVDMVPAVRNQDSVAGLYDRVRHRFYPSASGTDFTAGTQVGDGKLYIDVDGAFAGSEIAGNITLVKKGEKAFDGGGMSLATTLRPEAGTVGGVVLQDGATLDLSALSEAFSLDDNAISFADGSTIYVDIGSRNVSPSTPVVSWTTAPSNIGGLRFRVIANGKEHKLSVQDDGLYYLGSGIVIFVM